MPDMAPTSDNDPASDLELYGSAIDKTAIDTIRTLSMDAV